MSLSVLDNTPNTPDFYQQTKVCRKQEESDWFVSDCIPTLYQIGTTCQGLL